MTVKSDRGEVFRIFMVLFASIMTFIFAYPVRDDIEVIVMLCLCNGFFLIFLAREVVSRMRSLYFEEDGVTVRFAFYQKKYQWSDFVIKRMEYYGWKSQDGTLRVITYERGAYFCPYKIRKKVGEPPALALTPHLFSLVYVNFVPSPRPKNFYGVPISYPVDEEIFLAKMKEWGVELEYLNPPRKRIGYNRHL